MITLRSRVPHWDDVAKAWGVQDRERLWRSYSDELHARLLAEWLPPAPVKRVLKTDAFEEAVGALGLHAKLASVAQTVVSVDLSAIMLSHARKRHPSLHPVSGSVGSLPIRDQAFDVVVSTSTLDHLDSLDDVAASLRELHRVLRPGGRLILTLDNRTNPVIALRSVLPHGWLRRLRLVPYETGANCGARRLAQLAIDAGFEPMAVGSLMHSPRLPCIWLGRVLERLGSARIERTLVRSMLALEHLERWPTRALTGYFVKLIAVRPG